MSPCPPCPDLSRLSIGSLKSANIIGNINTAESQQKNGKQVHNRRKGSAPLGPGGCLDYTSKHLLPQINFCLKILVFLLLMQYILDVMPILSQIAQNLTWMDFKPSITVVK